MKHLLKKKKTCSIISKLLIVSKKFNINKLILVKISINLVNLNIVKNVSIKFFIYLIIIYHPSIATYAVLSSYLPRAIESLANLVGKFILLTYMINTQSPFGLSVLITQFTVFITHNSKMVGSIVKSLFCKQ